MLNARRIARVAVLAATAATAFGAGPAAADTPEAGTLDSRHHPLLWTGQVARSQAPSAEVPECSLVACDRFDLVLDLPGTPWKHRPGGVEVSIRWFGTFGDNLQLYVYRQGSLLARLDGIIASAQSVLIPSAGDGRYAVYVAFDPIDRRRGRIRGARLGRV